MTVIAFPADVSLANFSAQLSVNQRSFGSPFGGSEQVVDLLNDRWIFSFTTNPRTFEDAATLEAFIAAMRGMTNTTELHHFARPTPLGTISGSVTAQAAAQGAASIVLNATTGHTLKAGDLFGVDGLLLQVASDCTAVSGEITVPLVNRLRKAIAADSAVTLTEPKASFRFASAPRVIYVPGYADSVAMDFLEHIAS